MHSLVVIDVDRQGDVIDNLQRILERSLEGSDNIDRVDISFELREGLC